MPPKESRFSAAALYAMVTPGRGKKRSPEHWGATMMPFSSKEVQALNDAALKKGNRSKGKGSHEAWGRL